MHIGIDIGGSAIKMGAVATDGVVLARRKLPSVTYENAEDLVSDLAAVCRDLENETRERARAVGVCSPGYIDPDRGILTDGGANVTVLRGHPLAQMMSARFNLPTRFANDGVAAVTGEMRFGAGRDFRRLVMLTLGTGVGGCVAVNGEAMTGPVGEPPELGAMILSDAGAATGQEPRSLESFACTAGFLRAYREAGGCLPIDDVRTLFARTTDDAAAAAAVDGTARRIAQALGSLINALALDACVIGGGIAASGEALIGRIRAHLPDFTWPLLLTRVSVVQATRGNDAGFIGAAALAADALSVRNRVSTP